MADHTEPQRQQSELRPQPEPGFLRSFGLALLVHALLIAALTWGVSWRQTSTEPMVQAELWSTTVQRAAPAEVAPPPPPPPPEPEPSPDPEPPKPVPQPPAPPVVKVVEPEPTVDPQIAIEKAKKAKEKKDLLKKQREEQERAKAEALEREREQKKELEAKKQKQEKLAKEKLNKAKRDQVKAEKLKEQPKELSAKDKAAAEKARADNLKRVAGLAGATGAPTATGKDKADTGPSDSYSGRIAARIRPNVTYLGDKSADIVAEVEIRIAPDGRIVSATLTRRSGVAAWDEACLNAIAKTEVVPLDSGRAVSTLTLVFSPREMTTR